MKKILLVTLGLFVTLFARTVTTYTIDIDQPEKEILRGHLDLGGSHILLAGLMRKLLFEAILV